jgi:predicted ATP-grasp superfamily ATP-dependent carboligase
MGPRMNVVIIGASARAAAASGRRAGLRPWCADLFADVDCARHGPVRRVPMDDYPHGLLAALEEAPRAPLLYTGGLENYPTLLARIPLPLWGNGAQVVRRVRSPFALAQRLRAFDLPCPAVCAAAPAPSSQRWLLKPRRGAAGFGMHPYRGAHFNPRTHYVQEWLDGMPCSAVFLGHGDGSADLLGTTRQLIGTPWLHAGGFRYAGSIGPLVLPATTRRAWQALGACLSGEFGLRGLFGVDAILRDGVPWPVEVNPRYTASVEVLERSLDRPLLALHRAVFEKQALPLWKPPAPTAIWGKAIVYARDELVFPVAGPWCDMPDELAPFADIPHAGERIEAGQPVLTAFAQGASEVECERRLREDVQALDRHLWG